MDPLKAKAEKRKPAKKKGGLHLAEIRVRPLEDGTHHIEHHYEDANHLPHHHTPAYSAATVQDVQDHMAEHLQDPAADPGAAADPAQVDPAAPPQE